MNEQNISLGLLVVASGVGLVFLITAIWAIWAVSNSLIQDIAVAEAGATAAFGDLRVVDRAELLHELGEEIELRRNSASSLAMEGERDGAVAELQTAVGVERAADIVSYLTKHAPSPEEHQSRTEAQENP